MTTPTFASTETFASMGACRAAIIAAGLDYDNGKFGRPGVHYVYGTRANGVSTYRIAVYQGQPEVVAPAKSERHIYEKGHKRSIKDICGTEFKRAKGNKAAYIAATTARGVRPATANAQWSHWSVGRWAA